MYHRAEDRIRGHVQASVLALLLERAAERETGQRWNELRRTVERQKMVAYEGSSGRVVQTTDLSPEHRKLLKDLEITPPKLVHDVA
jgi:hypothetical protein